MFGVYLSSIPLFPFLDGNSGEDLTAARKFQMDANGRKFENRVAAWREAVGVIALGWIW